MNDFNKFLDEHELLATINVPAAAVSEFAGIGKNIDVFIKRKEKITEDQQIENPFYFIIQDNNKTIIYGDNELFVAPACANAVHDSEKND